MLPPAPAATSILSCPAAVTSAQPTFEIAAFDVVLAEGERAAVGLGGLGGAAGAAEEVGAGGGEQVVAAEGAFGLDDVEHGEASARGRGPCRRRRRG